MPSGFHTIMRWVRRAKSAFPDTKPYDMPARMRALDRRRAKNRVAKASRKRNRR
jgi:hypothetical protein